MEIKLTAKEKFIIDWINKNDNYIDILNRTFTDDYINTFYLTIKQIKFKNWGSHYIPELSGLLKKMYDKGILDRQIVSICPKISGFPNWVYTYNLKNRRY